MNAPPRSNGAAPRHAPETRPEFHYSGINNTPTGEWKYTLPLAVHSSLDDAGLSSEQFRVMAAICRKCGDGANGRQCDAAIETLACVCRLHPDTVRKAIAHLKELGWVEVIDRPGRTKVHIARFPDHSGLKVGVGLQGRGCSSREGLPFEGSPPSGPEVGPSSGFEGDEGNPIREPPKGTLIKDSIRVDFPKLPFKSEAFKEAWTNWEQHRWEIKKKITPTSAKAQFKTLAAMGETKAIAAIYHSIEKGYQGIFEPSPNSTTAERTTSPINTGNRRGYEEPL